MGNQQIAVVTGAGSGIGRAIALRLGEEGYIVCIVDLNSQAAKETELLLRQRNINVFSHVLDITRENEISAFIEQLERVDVLVNNAGIFSVKSFEELTNNDFQRMYEVNLISIFSLSRQVLSKMPEYGRIVNIASRAALGARNYAHYVASKAAVVGLTRAMALDLAKYKINVNAVAPGVIQTPMLLQRSDIKELMAQQPLGNLGEADDIAHAVAFFADKRSKFITGQVLLVDGGRSIGGTMAF